MNPALQKLYFKSFMTLRPGKSVTLTSSGTENIYSYVIFYKDF